MTITQYVMNNDLNHEINPNILATLEQEQPTPEEIPELTFIEGASNCINCTSHSKDELYALAQESQHIVCKIEAGFLKEAVNEAGSLQYFADAPVGKIALVFLHNTEDVGPSYYVANDLGTLDNDGNLEFAIAESKIY